MTALHMTYQSDTRVKALCSRLKTKPVEDPLLLDREGNPLQKKNLPSRLGLENKFLENKSARIFFALDRFTLQILANKSKGVIWENEKLLFNEHLAMVFPVPSTSRERRKGHTMTLVQVALKTLTLSQECLSGQLKLGLPWDPFAQSVTAIETCRRNLQRLSAWNDKGDTAEHLHIRSRALSHSGEIFCKKNLQEYREAFKCFDLNENGTLSTKELKYAMRMLGSNPTDTQIQQLVNAKDFDGDGTINFDEFVTIIEDENSIEEDENLFMIFGVFDPENNGYIDGGHIKRSLQSLVDVPPDEIEDIIQNARITDDRKFALEEFSALLVPLIFSRKRGRYYHGDRRSWHSSRDNIIYSEESSSEESASEESSLTKL
ncbi:unnamed protein product [Porites evermanni]|uniref:EF-hand domain-containing protein n=1 Tax=Porites evermanni TaxID=104178 RepID=A0ABN8R4I4_9CNID|nr:unnamed protein product [Porites evermanni]